MDGANLNALLGVARPADMGFDITHLNLHKTFSTPHGGGGPGSGPIGVVKRLRSYLPVPLVTYNENADRYEYEWDLNNSIGKIHTFYGNFGMIVRAYAYIRMLGARGLKEIAKNAIINANYLREQLNDTIELPYTQHCMHEFVLSGTKQKSQGVKTLEIAKRLLDFGFHAPTIYFPLIVKEALMIEPTESEKKDTLDQFAETLKKINKEIIEQPDLVNDAPHNTPVDRVDEVNANRNLNLKWS
jgi:glycine dehydrogenase subunit 2